LRPAVWPPGFALRRGRREGGVESGNLVDAAPPDPGRRPLWRRPWAIAAFVVVTLFVA
jgi:hypothetical protein